MASTSRSEREQAARRLLAFMLGSLVLYLVLHGLSSLLREALTPESDSLYVTELARSGVLYGKEDERVRYVLIAVDQDLVRQRGRPAIAVEVGGERCEFESTPGELLWNGAPLDLAKGRLLLASKTSAELVQSQLSMPPWSDRSGCLDGFLEQPEVSALIDSLR